MSSTAPQVLDAIVKAYDVRGTVPDQLNTDVAHALGVGFARFAQAPRVLVGRDMRPSGPELVDAFIRGVLEQGVDVVDLGLASTDLVYFAAGTLDAPGAMFTASHNPAQYNGVKFCLSGARVAGQTPASGIGKVVPGCNGPAAPIDRIATSRNLLSVPADHVVSFIDPARCIRCGSLPTPPTDGRPSFGGVRAAAASLEVMYGEPTDLPNHPADPLQPANQRDLQARVVAGDRCRRRSMAI